MKGLVDEKGFQFLKKLKKSSSVIKKSSGFHLIIIRYSLEISKITLPSTTTWTFFSENLSLENLSLDNLLEQKFHILGYLFISNCCCYCHEIICVCIASIQMFNFMSKIPSKYTHCRYLGVMMRIIFQNLLKKDICHCKQTAWYCDVYPHIVCWTQSDSLSTSCRCHMVKISIHSLIFTFVNEKHWSILWKQ